MLRHIQQLFEAGRQDAYAAKLAAVLEGDDEALVAWLTSGGFWGGMGSMMDCAFCTPSGLGQDADAHNSREFMRLAVKLGRHQLSSGIVNSGLFAVGIQLHIRNWVEIFEVGLRRGRS